MKKEELLTAIGKYYNSKSQKTFEYIKLYELHSLHCYYHFFVKEFDQKTASECEIELYNSLIKEYTNHENNTKE